MKVGQWLLEEKGQVPLKELAKRLDVSVRTLHNWRDQAKKVTPPKIGRPSYSEAAHKSALWLVGRELRRQGYPGWRAVAMGLRQKVPTRLIQIYVQKFKLRRRKRQRQFRQALRVLVKVKSKNVMWAQDGTHLGRHEGKSIEAQVIKDRASQKLIGISTGPCANGRDVVNLLESIKVDRGLPLVLSTDNGSMYLDKSVSEYLKKEKIIHLKSLPQTPEHNGAAEIGMREIKRGSNLGKGRSLSGISEAHHELIKTANQLNENRLRASLRYESAAYVDRKLRSVYTKEDRARFYNECCDAMISADRGDGSVRRRRMDVRNVVLNKLEEYGFIELKRGNG